MSKEITMPVYYWCEDENGDICDESDKKHYDFDEMANQLEIRICEILNRNVSITISEQED